MKTFSVKRWLMMVIILETGYYATCCSESNGPIFNTHNNWDSFCAHMSQCTRDQYMPIIGKDTVYENTAEIIGFVILTAVSTKMTVF
jgi:hypothetical protein